MEPLKTLGGGAFVVMKFQIEDDMATAGVPVIPAAASDAGLQLGLTTTSVNTYGITIDTATGNTGSLISVVVNPDLVIRGKLSGGSTADTALTVATVTVATSTTVFDVSGLTLNSPDVDDGVVWGYTGVNAGVYRLVTATDADTCTVVNAWPTIEAVGDTFLFAARGPGGMGGIALTSNVAQIDATNDNDDATDSYWVLDAEFRTAADSGTTNSFLHVIAGNHAF